MEQTITPQSTPQSAKPRIEWLDAMRGFTMILVVACHVTIMGIGLPVKESASLPFLTLFRMPLFFFVSGFLAYKASIVWNASTLCSLVLKKMRVQIIPTVVFFLFAAAVLYPHFWPAVQKCIHVPTKGGYWFTIALLYMFVLYYLFAYVESKLARRSWIPIAVFFLLSMLVYESCYMPRVFWWAQGYRKPLPSTLLDDTSFIQVMMYMPYFLFGNIVRRYWTQAQRLMDTCWFYPLLIVLVVFSTLDVLKWHTMRMAWANLPYTLSRFSLIIIVVMYFRHYAQYFTQSTLLGSVLQYIGRRTLDIYLLHFLFLPHLPQIGKYFQHNHHNFVIDSTLSVLLAMLVIAFCIITSNILRVSPFLRKCLFGRG